PELSRSVCTAGDALDLWPPNSSAWGPLPRPILGPGLPRRIECRSLGNGAFAFWRCRPKRVSLRKSEIGSQRGCTNEGTTPFSLCGRGVQLLGPVGSKSPSQAQGSALGFDLAGPFDRSFQVTCLRRTGPSPLRRASP